MPSPRLHFGTVALACMLVLPPASSAARKEAPRPTEAVKKGAAPQEPTPPPAAMWSRRAEPMVEVTTICPTILYELRYATARNFTGRQIYPKRARCLVRQSVALRLKRAQEELRRQGYGLKIWDAYRPAWAHEFLWKSAPNPQFVAAPSAGGTWHTRGTAVDVTLVDLHGREQKMPTDFDDFTAAAKSDYRGADPRVAARVRLLRVAMENAGFKGLRDEWWHFKAEDSIQFAPVRMTLEKGGWK